MENIGLYLSMPFVGFMIFLLICGFSAKVLSFPFKTSGSIIWVISTALGYVFMKIFNLF
jgi:hypothetical protein